MSNMLSRIGFRTLYLYAVCLITLVMLLIGGVQTVKSAVRLAYPGVEYYEPYYAGPEGEKLSEEDQAKMEKRQKEAEKRRAVLDLAGALSLLAVASPVYLYHWKRAQKENAGGKVAEDEPAP